MIRLYSAVGILLVIALLVAGFVAYAKSRQGFAVTPSEVMTAAAALALLVLGTVVCGWACFALAGGPDGRFLARESLGYGLALLAIASIIVLAALHLLTLSANWTAIFLIPAGLAVIGAAIGYWPLALAAFTGGPLICLVATVTIWVRTQLAIAGA